MALRTPQPPAQEPTRNVYSLNDRPVSVDMGQFSDWTINPCPDGAPWGVTIIEHRTVKADSGDDKFTDMVTTADALANDLVNRYPGQGLFLAEEDDAPSAAEVAQATQEFELADMSRITHAQQVWDAKKDRSKILRQERDAARRRHQTVDWAQNALVELKVCQFCGENVKMSAIKCKHCSSWLDGREAAAPTASASAPALQASPSPEPVGKRR